MALAMTDLNSDAIPDVTFSLGYSSTGADHFFIQNSQTGAITWQSDDLEGPFKGYAVYDYLGSFGFGFDMMAFVSSSSESGYGGGQVIGLNFDEKFEVWRVDLGESWSGVHELVAGDVDGDGLMEVVTFGSWTYDGRIHVIDGLTGALRSVFR